MNRLVCPTARMEKLMVATDGSDYSESAIREAINLARICSSRLFVVSIVTTNLEFQTVVPQVMEKEEKEAREHLDSVKSRAAKEGIECDVIDRLSEEPFQDIIDLAEKNKVDMIIVGTHGRTGLKRLMMGSVTAKVIGHAHCNVLVVPLHAKVECRNILVATDGSKYSAAAASEAIGIAKKCGSSLFVISVASTDTEVASAAGNVKKVTDTAEKENIHIEGIAVKGKPYEAITETAKQKRADLIIMGSHGKTGLERLLMGSVTERVIGHSGTAVLVVRKPH